jgi:hypothetical protein
VDWTNPLPFALGGGPTDVESMWRALRGMVGGEHGPGPEEGIEDLARQQEATALVGADRAIERAFFQAFPSLSTDALPIWEALFQVAGASDDVQLRALLLLAWQSAKGSTTPSLAADLLAISSQLSIDLEDTDEAIVTIPGKYLAPVDNVPPYGLASPVGLVSALFPNYASVDVLRVVYALDSAAGEIEIPDEVSRAVAVLLNRRLPSWQTWTLVQQWEGSVFLLDGGDHGESVFDVTPLG